MDSVVILSVCCVCAPPAPVTPLTPGQERSDLDSSHSCLGEVTFTDNHPGCGHRLLLLLGRVCFHSNGGAAGPHRLPILTEARADPAGGGRCGQSQPEQSAADCPRGLTRLCCLTRSVSRALEWVGFVYLSFFLWEGGSCPSL